MPLLHAIRTVGDVDTADYVTKTPRQPGLPPACNTEIKMVMQDIPFTSKRWWRIEDAYKPIRNIRPVTAGRRHSIRTP